MQQSLQASKAGQEAKRIEAQREQERVLQVLKSSTRGVSPPKRVGIDSGSSRSSLDGAGSTIPVLPPRRRVSPPASVASTRSFEQVAGASLVAPGPLRRSRSPSLTRPTTDLPPPVHPNRKTTLAEFASSSSPAVASSPSSPRFGRSKSVHNPSPPPSGQRAATAVRRYNFANPVAPCPAYGYGHIRIDFDFEPDFSALGPPLISLCPRASVG